MDERTVKEELLHSLHEWGVSGTHKDHVDFRRRVIEEGSRMVSLADGFVDFDDLKHVTFPKTIHQAYHHVLVSEVENLSEEKCIFTTDTLDVEDGVFGEPKFRWFNKRFKPPRIDGYRLKRQFRGISDFELDPLRRYEFETFPKDEYFFKRWFIDHNVESEMGTFLEAWFACHAIKEEACFNCKCRKSLRWAGGCGASWQDLICVACGCMYELKTKASMEKIEKTFHYNRLPCGSFKKYCMIENSRNDDQKMFLVLLPRDCTLNNRREESHPVILSEIKSISPRLFEGTFNPDSSIRLKSLTTMNLNTKRKWFDLPATESVNLKDTMKKVFEQMFGKKGYEKCLKRSLRDSSSDDSDNEEIIAQLERLTM